MAEPDGQQTSGMSVSEALAGAGKRPVGRPSRWLAMSQEDRDSIRKAWLDGASIDTLADHLRSAVDPAPGHVGGWPPSASTIKWWLQTDGAYYQRERGRG